MKKGIKKLGKGLSALLPETHDTGPAAAVMNGNVETAAQAGRPVELPVEEIHLNPHQPREYFSEDRLRDLADSITAQGVIQPLVVRQQDDEYVLIAGERRLRASQMAGLTTVPAVISDISDDRLLEATLVENLQREDLNVLEVAHAYEKLAEKYNLTHEEIGKQIGVSREQVTNTLRLLLLPQEIQWMILQDILMMGHAKILLSLGDEGRMVRLAHKIEKQSLSVRETMKLAKKMTSPPARAAAASSPQPAAKPRDAVVEDLEDRLRKHFGTKVRIDDKQGKGQIHIDYYSQADFSRIMEVIGLTDT